MLLAGVMARDAAGRPSTVDPGVAVFFNGGTPVTELGRLQIVATGGVTSFAGLLYDVNGRLVVAPAGVIAGYVAGLPVTAVGALCVAYGGTPVGFVAGIPVDSAGRVCMVAPVAPVEVHAFNSAFDLLAFD